MAAEDSKPRKVVELAGTGRLAQVSVSRIEWTQAMEDKGRADAIVADLGFDILLAAIIRDAFPKRTTDVQKLMNGINMIQKARLANILGLIDKTVFDDLKQIHEIRNRFGHSLDAMYAHTELLKLVKKLSTAKDNKVTAENSYKFFKHAERNCVDYIVVRLRERKRQKAQKS